MSYKKDKDFEAVINAPWWLGISVAIVMFIASIIVKHFQIGMFHFEGMLSMFLKFFAVVFALGGVVSFFRSLISGRLFSKTNNLQDIKAIGWQEFEHLIGEYYRRRGYSVFQMGGDSPDGGIDLIAQKNGEKLVIQCKHWKAFKIDVKVARELYGVMVDATASGAVLITSGDFAQPAIDFVKDKPIELVDGPKLARLIAEVKTPAPQQVKPPVRRAVLIPTEPPPLTKEEQNRKYMPPGMRAELGAKEKEFAQANPVCPHCNKPMILRVAQKGPTPGAKFWGCANYPACRHTMQFVSN